MKRTVTITIAIDPTKYEGGIDSDQGTIDLLVDCLENLRDFPDGTNTALRCGICSQIVALSKSKFQ